MLACGRRAVKQAPRPVVGKGEVCVALVASVRDEDAKKPATLDRLTALLKADLDRVNTLILERMQSPVALIPQLAGHIVAAGGKRLRPMLTLATARMCGYRGERHVALAAAVEFIHTATLLHDDVVDASDLRRGLATANAVWGNKSSVLVGDFLFSRAFKIMVEDGSFEVLGILSEASAIIAEGEVLQLVTSNDTEATEEAERWLGQHCNLVQFEHQVHDDGIRWKRRFAPQLDQPEWRVEVKRYECR